MTWRDVEALAKDGWQIGSHGIEHVDLTRQSSERVKRELEQSKSQSKLVSPCRAKHLRTHGDGIPSRTSPGPSGRIPNSIDHAHAPLGDADDLLRLPRIDVHSGYSFEDFVAVVNGDWDYLGWIQATRALASSIVHR